MMTIIRIGLCLASLAVTAIPADAATKVFLLAGQSNMAGVGGRDSICPAPYNASQDTVKLWDNGWANLRPGFGFHSDQFGPEVSFGYALRHAVFPNDDIYLVKLGITSTNLINDWNPQGADNCYTSFRSKVKAAMKSLADAGRSPAIAGMLWMQGEADTADADSAKAYAANLTNFITQVRIDFATPDMPFVLGRILTCDPVDNAMAVRAAQQTVPKQMEHVAWIDTDDLKLAYAGHYGTQGQIDLGLRFAQQLAEMAKSSTRGKQP